MASFSQSWMLLKASREICSEPPFEQIQCHMPCAPRQKRSCSSNSFGINPVTELVWQLARGPPCPLCTGSCFTLKDLTFEAMIPL
jgi:hypothetical protein